MEHTQAKIIEASPAQRHLLRALFELYAHDLSPFTGADVDADGRFTPAHFLKGSWSPDFHPFLLRVNGAWTGFAWVTRGSYISPGRAMNYLMAEFFILRKYRQQGLGQRFAHHLFRRFPGVWEVGQLPLNQDAIAFWRRVIGTFTDGQYEELHVDNDLWHGPVQRFITG